MFGKAFNSLYSGMVHHAVPFLNLATSEQAFHLTIIKSNAINIGDLAPGITCWNETNNQTASQGVAHQ